MLTFFLLEGCVFMGAFTGHTEIPAYIKHDFHGTYRKYLVKDGYIRYEMFDTTAAHDTTWVDLYFDNYGAREYIRAYNERTETAYYKIDSVQYRSSRDYFDSAYARRFDFLFEGAVMNKTSKLSNLAYTHKPMDVKFQKKRCAHAWTYALMDSVKYECAVSYYMGIPVHMHMYGHPMFAYRTIRASIIDTNAVFPIVIKVK